MISIKEFATGFNLARVQMPQIDDVEEFCQYCKDQGYAVDHSVLTPLHWIKPTQFDFNQDKVDAIKASNQSNPFIITKDHYVLDGHHRYYAAVQTPGVYDVHCVMIDCDINHALKLAYDYLGDDNE